MKHFFSFLCVALFAVASAAAQGFTLTGRVVDATTGAPILGAVVTIRDTNHGVATDIDGKFTLPNVKSGQDIVASYLGYTPQTIKAADNGVVEIRLLEDAISVDQVVIVGYGTQKKANLTGAISQIDMTKVLGDRPVSTVGAALQGAIPGLIVTGGAVPGYGQEFNIRGFTSINGGGPLVLIDNVPGDINLLNPEDIQSVTVLKDAASSAIYGARAAFGVILITTKRANKNTKLQINYNNNFAFTRSNNDPVIASLDDYIATQIDHDIDGKWHAGQDLKEWQGYIQDYRNGTLMDKNPGAYLNGARFVPKGGSSYYYLDETNPISALFASYGFQQTHNLSATGGSEKINYRLSLGYVDNDGPLATNKDSHRRINVSSYVSADITKWLSTSLDIRYTKDDRTYVEAGGVYASSLLSPFLPTEKIPRSNDLTGPTYWVESPYAQMMVNDPARYSKENPRIYSRTSIHPIKGLEAIFEYTYDQMNYDTKSYNNPYEMINIAQGDVGRKTNLWYRNEKGVDRYNALNFFATYGVSTSNEKHNFKIMAGFSQEEKYSESMWARRLDMINTEKPSLTAAAGTTEAEDTFNEFAVRGGFFRVNYNFMDKYLLEVNGRYDGSSRFPKENRYGFFPSVSVGWQLAKEKFMDWSRSWLNELKIRASWGQIGNQNIGNYLYTPSMGSNLAAWVTTDMTKPTTLTPPALVRTNFTWEVVETLDIGAELALFNNRFTASGGWYMRDTKGMLAPGMELPSVVGANAPEQNVADLRTTGWELAAQWRDVVGDWNYSIGFNVFDYQTKITKYNNVSGVLGTAQADGTMNGYYEGKAMGEIWGFETNGFYSIDDFEDTWKTGTWKLREGVTSIYNNNNVRPGDVKFVNLRDDKNSTGAISEGDNTLSNPGDRRVVGNNVPRYQYGINASVGWKGIQLSVMLNGTGKRDAWISNDLIWPMNYSVFGTVYADQLDYWKPVNWNSKYGELDYTAVNENAYLPRIYDEGKNAGSNKRVQTKYLQDASYLRIKNITVSYSVPSSVMKKIGMTGAKIFFSGENLFTFTKLPKGIDPVRLSWAYPFYSTYSFGINLTL